MNLTGKKRSWLAVCVIISLAPAGSCKYDKEELSSSGTNPPVSCATTPASFNTDVLPLMTSKCAVSGCHDASAAGGRVFQNYVQISSAKDRINIRAVIQKSMPPNGPLTPAENNTLKCWIENGAPNN